MSRRPMSSGTIALVMAVCAVLGAAVWILVVWLVWGR